MLKIRRLYTLVLAVVMVATFGVNADATDYGSGVELGPVGTPVISTTPYTARSDVLIVGDSITVRGYKDLAAALPGRRLAVDAYSGRGTKLSVDAVLAKPYLPPTLIMAVGSNDVYSPFVMAAQVKRLLAGVPATTKVYWVDVQVSRPWFAVADQRNSMMVNRAIWQGCVDPCTVISWASFLAAKPLRIKWYLDSGGVHQTELGKKAWAAVIAAGVGGNPS